MAQFSEKWHHSLCRYLSLSYDRELSFGIIPGWCREVVGKRDWIYTTPECHGSRQTYVWTDFHAKKLERSNIMTSYYGIAPFLLDAGRVVSSCEEPKGSLFFLPRDDQKTIREWGDWNSVQQVIDSAPRPIHFLVPFRVCDVWQEWTKLNLHGFPYERLDNPETRQLRLSKLIMEHENIYIPWPNTDMYYSEFLDKNVVIYDDIRKYRTKTYEEDQFKRTDKWVMLLKWGYETLNQVQRDYFHWTEKWNDISYNDRKYLTIKSLGLERLESPDQLSHNLQRQGFLPAGNIKHDEDSYKSYLWLKDKIDNIITHSPSEKCLDMYSKL